MGDFWASGVKALKLIGMGIGLSIVMDATTLSSARLCLASVHHGRHGVVGKSSFSQDSLLQRISCFS